MVRTYIPGFTNMLEPREAPEYFGGPAYVGALPEPMEPPVAQAPFVPSVKPAAPPIMSAPSEQPFTVPQFSDLFPNGLDQETLAAMLSTAPGAVVSPAASQPGPGAGLVTTPGGEQGFYFYTDKGRLAGYDGKGGFIAVDPSAQYRMWDERGKNKIVASGTGQEALQQIYDLANQYNKEQGNKANYGIERLNPATGKWERVAENDPAKNIVGKIADIALPVAGSLLLPGVGGALGGALGAGLGAAGGSALSSIAQGRSLGDTLMRAGLSGVAAGGLSAIGGTPFIPSSSPTGALGGVAAGGVAGANQMALAGLKAAGLQSLANPGITVLGNVAGAGLGSAAGGALGSAAGSALGSALTGSATPAPAQPAPTQPQQPVEITPEGNLVLTGTRVPEVVNPLPFASAGAGALAQPGLDAVKSALEQQQQAEQQKQAEEEPVGQIDVVAPRAEVPVGIDIGSIAPVLPNLIPETIAAPSTADVGALQVAENEIVVRPQQPAETTFDGALGSVAPVLPNLIPSSVTAPEVTNEIVVPGEKPSQFEEAFPAVPDVGALIYPEQGLTYDDAGNLTEIVAEGTPTPKEPLPVGALLPTSVAPTLPDLTKTPVDVVGPEKSILDKLKENLGVTDYMRLAALGIGLLGGGGGGDRGALATIPSGLFGGGSGVFGGRLPAATLPGVSTGFAPRTADDLGAKTSQDWYRYGYGPEQSFFSYVPKGEPNTSRAYTGYEQAQADEDKGFAVGGMAGGGMRGPGSASNSYAVNGPGTGRSDEIPALLSDGEYVIDAETVALLGDGSPKAGAERLDSFRVNVRKHKGSKLAKGEFSPNAKRPEHYLKGGRA